LFTTASWPGISNRPIQREIIMSTNAEATVLIGSFADQARAARFVEELKRAGIRDSLIEVLSPAERPAGESTTEETAVAGALSGGTLGAVAGAVAAGLIPGVGPLLSTGVLASALGGAAAGAAAGGLLGAAVGQDLTEAESLHYEKELQRGRTLVVVKGGDRLGEAFLILRRLEEQEGYASEPPADELDVEELDQRL
jgi:hypothetical protein